MRDNDMLTAAEIRMLLKEEPNTGNKQTAPKAEEYNQRTD